MGPTDDLKDRIRSAFAAAAYPGDDDLKGGNEGVEPFKLEEEFKGLDDWRSLDAPFLDSAPDGYATALSFFSHAAFRFYLPAYLLADLDGQLLSADPVFHLCHGVEAGSRDEPINPRRYGSTTWQEYADERFGGFTPAQAAVIVEFLMHRRAEALTDLERSQIDTAIDGYWARRARSPRDEDNAERS